MSVNKVELQQLHTIDLPLLEEDWDTMKTVFPEIEQPGDEAAGYDLPSDWGNPQTSSAKSTKYELLLAILQAGADVNAVAAKVDEILGAEEARYQENMQAVFEQTKPFEKTARSLDLLYRNAERDANVYVMPVNATRFADSSNPKHFKEFRHFLRKKFYDFQMEDSPFYLSYVGNIGSKNAMQEMTKIAEETRALAVLDIRDLKSAKEVVDYAKSMKITGIPAHLAHQVTMGTWLLVHGAFEVEFTADKNGRLQRRETPMAVPAAGAFIGKMLSVPAGYYITGLEQSPIVGISGVKVAYDLQRIDARDWSDCGLIQIIPSGHIMGSTTANKSNNTDLTEFMKVDVSNSLLKDLVQFCNRKAYSKWGNRQKREFTLEIATYLNRRQSKEIFANYQINRVEYDGPEKVVEIDITIKFFDSADKFDINLHGPKNMIDFKKPDSKK
ncbi:MAG TPA: hypothetical protein PLO67_09980 [Saprospiraceae bacterium]|nr:hypothetical protein [Saprospiraceae bacterium]HPI06225.1 hypothetical protein [Saprospiraceae bacterium]